AQGARGDTRRLTRSWRSRAIQLGSSGTLPSALSRGRRVLFGNGSQSPSAQRFSHCSAWPSSGQLKAPAPPSWGSGAAGSGGGPGGAWAPLPPPAFGPLPPLLSPPMLGELPPSAALPPSWPVLVPPVLLFLPPLVLLVLPAVPAVVLFSPPLVTSGGVGLSLLSLQP